ncbi:hypothetical protein NT6N_23560 [Oceaniferula spumae]|uniref:Alpha/beta hydrolase n=1 Tax=Oceaniferula spumae TaxID=2979115 RepID=A0AAT9FMS7_9BACT
MNKFIPLLCALSLIACKQADSEKSKEPDTPIPEKTTAPTSSVIEDLRSHLSLRSENQTDLSEQKFANIPLTKEEAEKATSLLLADRIATLRAERQKEFDAKSITIGDKTLRYEYRTLGDEPKDGHSLYISMHGGGNAPAQVNDGQWQNQIKLYSPKEGIYLAPRAPTNTWNLWHEAHIDGLFDRLIENFIAIKGINPNKVYIMGYSAGGDGTYQLAPRMADRWAGAAMMAGHPGDAQTYNLRNLAYFIQCGGKDHAYNRAKLCTEWGIKLDQLAASDPGGYPHKCIVYPQHGHWMNREDKQAVPWMAEYTRNPWPTKILWHQDDITIQRFYWLENEDPKHNQLITAEVDGQTITLTVDNSKLKDQEMALNSIIVRLSDQLLNLDQPITIKSSEGKILFQGKVNRTMQAIAKSLDQRPDPTTAATATVKITF